MTRKQKKSFKRIKAEKMHQLIAVRFDLQFIRAYFNDVLGGDIKKDRERLGTLTAEIRSKKKGSLTKEKDEAMKIQKKVEERMQVEKQLEQILDAEKKLVYQVAMLEHKT